MAIPQPISLDDVNGFYLQVSPNSIDNPRLKFTFNHTTGKFTVYKNSQIGNTDVEVGSGFWKQPADNTTYYIRFQSALTPSTGSVNTWLTLDNIQSVEWTASTVNTVEGAVTISIAADNLGSTLFATKTINFYISKTHPYQNTNLNNLNSKYVVSNKRAIAITLSGNGSFTVDTLPFSGVSTNLTTSTWKNLSDTSDYYVRFTGAGDEEYVANTASLNSWHLLSAVGPTSAVLKFEDSQGQSKRTNRAMKLTVDIAKGAPGDEFIIATRNVGLGLTFPILTTSGNLAVDFSTIPSSYSANTSIFNPTLSLTLDEAGTWSLQGIDDAWSGPGGYGSEHGETVDSGTWFNGESSSSLIKFYMQLKSDVPTFVNDKTVVTKEHFTNEVTYQIDHSFESYDWVPIYIGGGRHYTLTVENPFKKLVNATANTLTGNIIICLATDQFGINVVDYKFINFSLVNNTVFTPGLTKNLHEMKKTYTHLTADKVPGLRFGLLYSGPWNVAQYDEVSNSYVTIDNGKWRDEEDMHDYYVRFTSNVGVTSGTLNTWLPLIKSDEHIEQNHFVAWQDTTNNTLGVGGSLTIDISHNGSNSGIVYSKPVHFAVNKGPYPVSLSDMEDTYNNSVPNTTVKFEINSNGTWVVYNANVTTGLDQQIASGRWRTIGDSSTYFVKFESSTNPVEGTRDVWQSTATTRTIKWVDTTPAGTSTNGHVTIYLATDLNGANVVAEKYIHFSLNNTTLPKPDISQVQNVYEISTDDPDGVIIQFHLDGTWDVMTNNGEIVDSGRWCAPGDESLYFIKFESSTIIDQNLGTLNAFLNMRSHGE